MIALRAGAERVLLRLLGQRGGRYCGCRTAVQTGFTPTDVGDADVAWITASIGVAHFTPATSDTGGDPAR
jgi:hypothetical protein